MEFHYPCIRDCNGEVIFSITDYRPTIVLSDITCGHSISEPALNLMMDDVWGEWRAGQVLLGEIAEEQVWAA